MKNFILLSISLFIMSCDTSRPMPSKNLGQNEVSERRQTKVEPQAKIDPQVAVAFLNDYLKSSAQFDHKFAIITWSNDNPLTTLEFKSSLEHLVRTAFEENPQMGLGADPIFDAQDFPSEGFKLNSYNESNGYVLAQGRDWEEFEVMVKLVLRNGKTLVDGCGIVRMSENK